MNKRLNLKVQIFLLSKMTKWLKDFRQMVPADCEEAVEVVDMAEFAAVVGGESLKGLQRRGQYSDQFKISSELYALTGSM